MTHNAFYSVQLEGEISDLLALETLWEERAVSTSVFEVSEKDALWSLEALFVEEPDLGALFEGAGPDLFPYQHKARLTYLPPTDWLAQNRLSFAPLTIGRFYIHGEEAPPAPQDKISLEISASTAFGTGRHETTRGCILLLEALAQDGKTFEHILDLGCGTGILAMAAAHLFPNAHVAASDNDVQATDMTARNLATNALSSRIEVTQSEGFDALDGAQFHLIVANILAGPLEMLAPEMATHTFTGAHLILSGILCTQADAVEARYKGHGFKVTTRHIDGDWCALCLEKKE